MDIGKIVDIAELLVGKIGDGKLAGIPLAQLVEVVKAVIAALPEGITREEASKIGAEVGELAYDIIAG